MPQVNVKKRAIPAITSAFEANFFIIPDSKNALC
jgi:hypothetical protein